MVEKNSLKSKSRNDEVLEHLSSWERTFWEMLQDQKKRGKDETEYSDKGLKMDVSISSAQGLRRTQR